MAYAIHLRSNPLAGNHELSVLHESEYSPISGILCIYFSSNFVSKNHAICANNVSYWVKYVNHELVSGVRQKNKVDKVIQECISESPVWHRQDSVTSAFQKNKSEGLVDYLIPVVLHWEKGDAKVFVFAGFDSVIHFPRNVM